MRERKAIGLGVKEVGGLYEVDEIWKVGVGMTMRGREELESESKFVSAFPYLPDDETKEI